MTQNTQSNYRLSSLFVPALIGTGIALTATVVSGVALHWIYRSSQLSRYAHGALFITASALAAGSATAFVIGVVVTFTQIKRRRPPTPLPSDRRFLDFFKAHPRPARPAPAQKTEVPIPMKPLVEKRPLSAAILEEIDERIVVFKPFVQSILKDETASAAITASLKASVVSDLAQIACDSDDVLSFLLDDIIGATFDCITANIDASALYKLSWAPCKESICKGKLVDGIDQFFNEHNATMGLSGKEVHTFMKSDATLDPLVNFIVKLCGSNHKDEWLTEFKQARATMMSHEAENRKKLAGMMRFTQLCQRLAL